ncbi:MAG: hypothetical protein EOP53_12435 [Sphingobacteriales bacterium]|nr:MAG: hypothetical protein EOP53_12435 [Sphingobacteriales bacterium]
MKIIFVFIMFLFSCTALHAQERGCKTIREGKFRVVSKEAGTTYVTRSKNIQKEDIPDVGVIMIFDINWIDDCTYTLRPKKVLKGNPALLMKGLVITVKVKNLDKNSYIAETTMNITDLVQHFKMEIDQQ